MMLAATAPFTTDIKTHGHEVRSNLHATITEESIMLSTSMMTYQNQHWNGGMSQSITIDREGLSDAAVNGLMTFLEEAGARSQASETARGEREVAAIHAVGNDPKALERVLEEIR